MLIVVSAHVRVRRNSFSSIYVWYVCVSLWGLPLLCNRDLITIPLLPPNGIQIAFHSSIDNHAHSSYFHSLLILRRFTVKKEKKERHQ